MGGDEREGVGDGCFEGVEDGLSLLWGVELEVVEFFDGLAVAVEGLGSIKVAEVLGIST